MGSILVANTVDMMDAAEANSQLANDFEWFNNCTDQYTKVDYKTLKEFTEKEMD